MKIGASSACFYPLETEKSFLLLAEMGLSHCEIFFNSHSELNEDFLGDMKKIRDAYGITVTSIHPYRSFSEGYDFFSRYKRRFYDGIENYKRLFEAARVLDADFVVMHGAKHGIEITVEEYAERFDELDRIAQSFGCNVAHENVVKYVGAQPAFMLKLKELLGDRFKAVLDIKQARRAGVDPMDFINLLGENIVHVHLSDYDEGRDCIAPSQKGLFNFEELFTALYDKGYKGNGVVELYSDGYDDKAEIIRAADYLGKIADKIFDK